MFGKEDMPYKHNDSQEYKQLISEAYNKYPENQLDALKYVKEKGGVHNYITFLLEITQSELIHESSKSSGEQNKYEFSAGQLEFMLRGFYDAVNHMPNDLPHGVYNYISNRSEDFLLKCLEINASNKEIQK
ncbi:hypothetical protein SAMN04487767_106239 [Bacillus wiedmannii]|uniref:Uncharacterized protein n=1 Tax=Bacillus wiedmannii TaxID=1890302 RepID=A0A0K6J0P5_9BACI|nr:MULTISPECIES: hypothetical protein [Bacillus]CUB08925.1 hypothetical protein BN2127_JRS1_00709 [Bacillus cereus]SDD49830.1 hypothetical protein SAMN04487767_106239 [Bacillus wiedmannii]